MGDGVAARAMPAGTRRSIAFVGMLILALAVTGCAEGVLRNPVPVPQIEQAEPFGRPGLRLWGDTVGKAAIQPLMARRTAAIKQRYGDEIAAGGDPQLEYLAISGGGQYGAFAAGVLRAWSESGDRPEFLGVSGISTGAIIAPFAFLGPDYDDILETFYTTVRTDDLLRPRILAALFSGAALSDTSPLAARIAQSITPEILAAIATEHRKGRELIIGTTNLDAGRPVLWDIGEIAVSGDPGALQLVRDLILASASIPVAFPPVFVAVRTPDGRTFEEMHVDGGAASQVTFVSPQIKIAEATREVFGRNLDRRLHIIVNNSLTPAPEAIRPRPASIGKAAVSSLIRGSGIGDLYRLFAIAERDEIDFRATWIPPDVPCPEPTEEFDPVFMRCLYDFGVELFRRGDLWRDAPPFFAR